MRPRTLSEFLRDDAGAVTVDWVVITAMIVAIPLLLYFALDDGIAGTTIAIHSEVNESADHTWTVSIP